MKVTSSEETLQSKESYEHLIATHSYCGVVSCHQNNFFWYRIKDFILSIQILLLKPTRLLPEAVSTIIWPLSFKSES